ncbi:MAG: helix-turn-helix domain-containing protein [Candidatus Eremiobacter antarcticus]|nr:helix-turn-helix domain-containing protein [Candidatus Eremiobacteraeota bacterium]
MTNIGEALSSGRERQGLSILEVARRLRIRTKFVEALEREEWGAIGEFVYVRGFLQNYATLLKLDPAPLVLRLREEYAADSGYARLPGTDARAFTAESHPVSRQPVKTARWFPWVLGTLTTVAVVLVGLVAVSVFGLMHAGPLATNDGSGSPIAGGSNGSRPANGSAAGSQTDTMEATAGNSLSSTQEAGVNLRLQLTQPSWLSVTVDGKRVVYETLPAGTTREFHGAREITLRAGNAGGVVASIDGKELGALGQAGQVKDKVFAVKPSPTESGGRHE